MVVAADSLRQRHADRTRHAIVRSALELFAERGFAATTIDELAARADIAPRTFFRYFASKEAVLYHDASQLLARTCDLLVARPPDEPAHVSLRIAFAEIADEFAADTERMRLIRRLSHEEPRLLDYQRVLLLQDFERELVDVLATRRGIPRDIDLRATTAALLSSLGVAFRSWIDAGAQGPLRPHVDDAISACRRAFSEPQPSTPPRWPA